MIDQVKEAHDEIVDWFASLKDTYIKCFGCQTMPHLMFRFMTNKVVLQEIAFELNNGFFCITP